MNVVLFGPTDIPRASPRIVNRTSRRGVGDDYLGSLFSRNNRHTIVAFTKEKGTMINVIYIIITYLTARDLGCATQGCLLVQ